MLSGPNALVDLVCFKTLRSSEMVNSEVGISKVSAIFSLGREILSGSFGSLPKRFPKCLAQLANLLDWDPPLRWMDWNVCLESQEWFSKLSCVVLRYVPKS